mmetsp:Transcript_46888/g.109544  ORF Transcript_46888/g.109544 Transcript_46888/m.109544 type:complete len:370 (+) Transcript_46888:38-1147(+)
MAACSRTALLLCLAKTGAAWTDASKPLTAEEVQNAFDGFKAFFRRDYADEDEEARRFSNFQATMETVRQHNSDEQRTWDMGLNQFSDMTDAEFESQVLMAPQKCSATGSTSYQMPSPTVPDSALEKKMDWRSYGVISEVKNQGSCGSCWAFSTAGCLEAHLAIKMRSTWRAPRLSEQQLVDCAQAFNNHGCNGGLPAQAFEYVRSAGGLSTEFHYPYKAKTLKCSFKGSNLTEGLHFEPRSAGIGVKVPGGSVNITAGDEKALKRAIALVGPVSVAFQVASDFRHYSSGVYSSKVCKSGPQDVNHAVLAIGYGKDRRSGKQYWLIKNSWDYDWGDEGFFKIEAFKNMCGVADCMAYPDLGLHEPESILV